MTAQYTLQPKQSERESSSHPILTHPNGMKKIKRLSNFHFNLKQSVRESGDRPILTLPPHKVRKSNDHPILIPPINGMKENLATAQFLFHPHMK
jgi:hypothetical protein